MHRYTEEEEPHPLKGSEYNQPDRPSYHSEYNHPERSSYHSEYNHPDRSSYRPEYNHPDRSPYHPEYNPDRSSYHPEYNHPDRSSYDPEYNHPDRSSYDSEYNHPDRSSYDPEYNHPDRSSYDPEYNHPDRSSYHPEYNHPDRSSYDPEYNHPDRSSYSPGYNHPDRSSYDPEYNHPDRPSYSPGYNHPDRSSYDPEYNHPDRSSYRPEYNHPDRSSYSPGYNHPDRSSYDPEYNHPDRSLYRPEYNLPDKSSYLQEYNHPDRSSYRPEYNHLDRSSYRPEYEDYSDSQQETSKSYDDGVYNKISQSDTKTGLKSVQSGSTFYDIGETTQQHVLTCKVSSDSSLNIKQSDNIDKQNYSKGGYDFSLKSLYKPPVTKRKRSPIESISKDSRKRNLESEEHLSSSNYDWLGESSKKLITENLSQRQHTSAHQIGNICFSKNSTETLSGQQPESSNQFYTNTHFEESTTSNVIGHNINYSKPDRNKDYQSERNDRTLKTNNTKTLQLFQVSYSNEEKRLKCDLCDFTVALCNKADMQIHLEQKVHYSASMVAGKQEQKSFRAISLVKDNSVLNHEGIFRTIVPICPECSCVFPTIHMVAIHYKINHDETVNDCYALGEEIRYSQFLLPVGTYMCKQCPGIQIFEKQKQLQTHWKKDPSHLPYPQPGPDCINIFICTYCKPQGPFHQWIDFWPHMYKKHGHNLNHNLNQEMYGTFVCVKKSSNMLKVLPRVSVGELERKKMDCSNLGTIVQHGFRSYPHVIHRTTHRALNDLEDDLGYRRSRKC